MGAVGRIPRADGTNLTPSVRRQSTTPACPETDGIYLAIIVGPYKGTLGSLTLSIATWRKCQTDWPTISFIGDGPSTAMADRNWQPNGSAIGRRTRFTRDYYNYIGLGMCLVVRISNVTFQPRSP